MKRRINENNRVLIYLSLTLLFPVCVLIKQSELPLVGHGHVLSVLFQKQDNWESVKEFSLSYLAAYLFFLFQTYFPSIMREKTAYKIMKNQLHDEILLLEKSIFFLNQKIITHKSGEASVEDIMSSIYYKNKGKLKRFTFAKTGDALCRELEKKSISIKSHSEYCHLNEFIIESNNSIPIDKLIDLIKQISLFANIEEKVFISENCISSVQSECKRLRRLLRDEKTDVYEIVDEKIKKEQIDSYFECLGTEVDELTFEMPINSPR